MTKNTLAAGEIGYLPVPEKLLGEEHEAMKLPPNKVCIIATGSQGQEGSALSRIAQNQHRTVKVMPGDTVFFSSDPIPGNEEVVYAMIEQLSLRGAEVVYSDTSEQIHASGHGNIDDLKLLLRFTKPRFMVPIGSTIRHHQRYQQICIELGHKKEHVFLLNEGDTLTFYPGGKAKPSEVIETDAIYVDAYGVGDVGTSVLRDRQTLAAEGIVLILIQIDASTKSVSDPKIISRGFVYEKTEGKLLSFASSQVKDTIAQKLSAVGPREAEMEVPSIKKDAIRLLERFFLEETGRRPLVIAEVVIT
jgi:ribonuclease J